VFCEGCGKLLGESARFCGACGRSTSVGGAGILDGSAAGAPPVASSVAVRTFNSQLRVLGILWAVYSGFRILSAVWLIVFSRMFMPMVSTMVPHDAGINIAPFLQMMSGFYIVSGVFSVLAAIVGGWASWALLTRQLSGRTLTLVVAFVSLISIPFGTALGVYTLVVLLPQSARQFYSQLTASA
jgi:hypothetical protein